MIQFFLIVQTYEKKTTKGEKQKSQEQKTREKGIVQYFSFAPNTHEGGKQLLRVSTEDEEEESKARHQGMIQFIPIANDVQEVSYSKAK